MNTAAASLVNERRHVQATFHACCAYNRLACPRHASREMFPAKPRNFSIPVLGDTVSTGGAVLPTT